MQLSLFENIDKRYISMEDAALQLNVSSATIYNWVREGLLETYSSYLLQDSWTQFVEKYVGISKLTTRANKLQKSHGDSLVRFSVDEQTDGRTLAINYEISLSESYRNKEGIYYTPETIVKDMLSSISAEDVGNKLFLEPCCGCGNFVIAAIKRGIRPENIYAFDIDETAVAITKQRIYEETGYRSEQVVCADFLQYARNLSVKFDYIFTNPPWGKKISKADKERYARSLGAGKSVDTSSLFFFTCVKLLAIDGQLGFLLPNAFFNVSTFADVREKALSLSINRLIDYGNSFKGLMTKAQAIVLSNTQVSDDNLVCCKTEKGIEYLRKQADFVKLPDYIINFTTDADEAVVIDYLLQFPHITLKNNAQWALGIVTGDNQRLLSDTQRDNMVPIYKGKDITPDGLLEPSNYIARDLSGCQQVAPMEFYVAPKKIVYRFISDSLICCVDDKQNYMLNSANILIPAQQFPISMEQLVQLLNSKVMNWLYKKIFHTNKVLRSDLEQLPIYAAYFDIHNDFSEELLLDYLNLELINGTYRIKR